MGREAGSPAEGVEEGGSPEGEAGSPAEGVEEGGSPEAEGESTTPEAERISHSSLLKIKICKVFYQNYRQYSEIGKNAEI